MNEESGPEAVSDLPKVAQVFSRLKHLLSEAIKTIILYPVKRGGCFIFALYMTKKRIPRLSILRV